MLRIAAILFGILCSTLAIAQNQPLACQTEAAAGLKWQDGRWQTRTFVERRFILVKSGKSLTIASVAKALDTLEEFVNCRNSVSEKIICSDTAGNFMFFRPETLKGGLASVFGASQSDQEQARDTVTVSAFSCTPF